MVGIQLIVAECPVNVGQIGIPGGLFWGTMAGDQSAQKRLLKEGIEALKNGNRVRGRDLLLRVVEKDRDVEAAWWWLYQAVDEPQGQMRALENVLRLNPLHAEAQQALTALRQKKLSAAQADWGSLLPEGLVEPDDGLDDLYQCPYCGQHTSLHDRRCPHCGHSLYAWVAPSGESSTLRLVLLLLGISLGAGVIEMIGPALALGVAQGSASRVDLGALLQFAFVQAFLGNFLQLARPAATLVLEIFAARAGLLAAILLSLRARWSVGYYAALIGAFGDLLLSAYLLVNNDLGVAGAVLNGALALAVGVVLFGLSDEFAITPQRVLVRPDTRARGALDFYKLGHRYRRRGMWAMAVAQWRRAVGLAPSVPVYYKNLGIAYAQIKRFSRSLRVLEEGRRQAPDDREIVDIIALVKSQADTHALLKK
jgi:tetratricopeptide (TPR) repeat protein